MAKTKSQQQKERPDWAVRLVSKRRDVKVSQTKLAEILSISQSAYADYETGRSQPSLEMFGRLARVLDTNPEWLIFGIGNRYGEESFDPFTVPVLSELRKKDEVFRLVSDQVVQTLLEYNFYPNDAEFILILASQMTRNIRQDFGDTPEGVRWGVLRTQGALDRVLKNSRLGTRFVLLANPDSYKADASFPYEPREKHDLPQKAVE